MRRAARFAVAVAGVTAAAMLPVPVWRPLRELHQVAEQLLYVELVEFVVGIGAP